MNIDFAATADVTVVGAGPSGSFIACLLAKAGFSVVLIDRKPFPRKKTCGGGVSQKASKLLLTYLPSLEIGGIEIKGSYLTHKNEELRYVGQEEPSYSVRRDLFDMNLVDTAQAHGVKFISKKRVINVDEGIDDVSVIMDGNDRLRSSYLVIADGIRGTLYKKLGYGGERLLTYGIEVDIADITVPEHMRNNTLFDFGSARQGYAWIFPKEQGVNAGVYYPRGTQIDRAKLQDLQRFLSGFSWLNNIESYKYNAHELPLKLDYESYNTSRTMIVGDTAGMVENFYGEGLYYGMMSSLLGSKVLTNAFRSGLDLDEYTRQIKRYIIKNLRYSRLTASLFYSKQRFGYYYLVRNKLMNKYYADLIHGNISQAQCFFYSALGLPISLLYGKIEERSLSEIGSKINM